MTQPGALNELHRKWVSPEQPNPEICREKQAWASGNNWDGKKKEKIKKKEEKKGLCSGISMQNSRKLCTLRTIKRNI